MPQRYASVPPKRPESCARFTPTVPITSATKSTASPAAVSTKTSAFWRTNGRFWSP